MTRGLLFLVIMLAVVSARAQHAGPVPRVISGMTMGTTYRVVYFDNKGRDFGGAIDSLLIDVNRSISTYDAGSDVSLFNAHTSGTAFSSSHFRNVVMKAMEVSDQSGGAFDITVMPLVNAWGFGPGRMTKLRPQQVDSIRAFVGRDKLIVSDSQISKTDSRVQLDFGGIGQGYGADVVADYLRGKSVTDFLVELGGEGVVGGRNLAQDRPWQIGILDPASTRDDQFLKYSMSLEGRAFSTSGNYFNYREVDGTRYGHTIDPSTGRPALNRLLSATVFADDCATADAWATAFMVMGVEKAIEKVNTLPQLDVIFIYSTTGRSTETFITDRVAPFVTTDP